MHKIHLFIFHFRFHQRESTNYKCKLINQFILGYAQDPSQSSSTGSKIIGDLEAAEKGSGITAFENRGKTRQKRKLEKNIDPTDVEGFKGPWAKYENEKTVMKPSEEEMQKLEEILAKRSKRGKQE